MPLLEAADTDRCVCSLYMSLRFDQCCNRKIRSQTKLFSRLFFIL